MGVHEVPLNVKIVAALAAPLRRGEVAGVCAELGISRESFYKYRRRFAAEGLAGLAPQSRRPARSPRRTDPQVEALILRLREELAPENGPVSIGFALRRRLDAAACPSTSTIYRVLRRHEAIEPEPRKRPRTSWRRFCFPHPNDCWQIDGSEWPLADGVPATIITVLDDHSRKVVANTVGPVEDTDTAWRALTEAMSRYGLPTRVLSDNSLAFNGSRRGVEVPTETRLRALGVTPIAAALHHPQTCGKVERVHRTMQQALSRGPAAGTLETLQQQVDAWTEQYNNRRWHQALDGRTPDEAWKAGWDAPACSQPDCQCRVTAATRRTPVTITTVRVRPNGTVAAAHKLIQVGKRWAGQEVTALRQDRHVVILSGTTLIRELDVDPDTLYQGNRPASRRPVKTFFC